LITAKDNSVGKSTVVKLLLWGLGCNPYFDTNWKSLDTRVIVTFDVEDKEYSVFRYKKGITLRYADGSTESYDRISEEYNKKFSEIVNFRALLPDRNDTELVVPPPAYYFVPVYIDQKKSWSKFWENFENLGQFERWQSPIIKFHVGLLNSEFFDLEYQKYILKKNQRQQEKDKQKLESAIEVLEEFIPKGIATMSNVTLTEMSIEIQDKLSELAFKQEKVLEGLCNSEAEKAFLEHQLVIAQEIIKELDEDYTFAVENIQEDNIECPLCGTVHDNSLINRASILVDKAKAEKQSEVIDKSLSREEMNLIELHDELHEIKKEIDAINEKYISSEARSDKSMSGIIEQLASTSIQKNMSEQIAKKLIEINASEKSIKEIAKSQNKTPSKEEKKNIESYFSNKFVKYIEILEARAVNISKVNSPLNYNIVHKEGGAAEGTRAMLAYYVALYSTIYAFGSEVKPPVIIDTPNQQEQSELNYDKIVDLFLKELPPDAQVIVCAMDNDHIKPFQDKATVISLDENKILRNEHYSIIKQEFDRLFT
jgi:hypothetical protein